MKQKEFALEYLAENGETAGDVLRVAMERDGHPNSTTSFYGTMARMEVAGLVAGDRRIVTEMGMKLRKVFYTLTDKGREYVSERVQ